jgi:hypothetical protein
MTTKLCKHEGCLQRVKGRGMCGTHYAQWCKQNPAVRMTELNEKLVFDSMPGTLTELHHETGMWQHAIKRALAVLRADERSHIGDHKPPEKSGERWQPIHYPGPGADKRLTKERKRNHHNMMRRQARVRLNNAPELASVFALPPGAGWAASLLAGLKTKGSNDAEAA